MDIDLNYIGPRDEGTMLAERGKVEAALSRILTDQGYAFRGPRLGVVGTKWLLGFRSALGRHAELKIDLGWLERRPLFPAARMRSARIGPWQARNVLVVSREEVTASKLAALFCRSRGRDVFDARSIMKSFGDLDWAIIRPAFYVFVAVSRTGWQDLEIGIAKAARHGEYMNLQACLPVGYFKKWRGPAPWFNESLGMCRRSFGSLDDPTHGERRFVDGVQRRGELDTGLPRSPRGRRLGGRAAVASLEAPMGAGAEGEADVFRPSPPARAVDGVLTPPCGPARVPMARTGPQAMRAA